MRGEVVLMHVHSHTHTYIDAYFSSKIHANARQQAACVQEVRRVW